jgi:prepilin-type N-terminal cleavage/methylation domain-containing protein
MNKAGYTLIEFLVVLGILAVTIGSTLVFLTTVLKGSGQANITSEVKQNGQQILDVLDSQIKNAGDTEDDGSGKYVKLTRFDDFPLHIKCFLDVAPKVENGWIGMVASDLPAPPDSDYLTLTNRNKVSGVDINDCQFNAISASAGASGPAVVSISYSVSQGIESPTADLPIGVNFSTTISLRQY